MLPAVLHAGPTSRTTSAAAEPGDPRLDMFEQALRRVRHSSTSLSSVFSGFHSPEYAASEAP